QTCALPINSPAILQELAAQDQRVRVIHLRKNFGQTPAINAGVDYSRGDIIVLMDADMQNDPADIEHLLHKLEEGYDIVSGWRKKRQDPYFMKVLPSRIANSIISYLTGVNIHDHGCTLKAYRRNIMQEISLYGEMHRLDRKSTRLNSSHVKISYAVFCLKKKKNTNKMTENT